MSTLKKWFGPSRHEVWQQLSAEIGGTHVDGWRGGKVQAAHGEWTVTLDTYTVPVGKVHATYTRMRAPYVNADGFRFSISRRNIFTGIATFLGMQDLAIGAPQFDEQFVIKATHEERVRTLFASPRLRELVDAQRDIHLSVKDDEGWFGATFPEGVDELYFVIAGEIRDVARLKLLYELFAETLDRLCEIGSAYERDPGVRL
jgi:hypothetical protein